MRTLQVNAGPSAPMLPGRFVFGEQKTKEKEWKKKALFIEGKEDRIYTIETKEKTISPGN